MRYLLLFIFFILFGTQENKCFSQFSQYGTKVYRQNGYAYLANYPGNFRGTSCEFKNKLFFYGKAYGRDFMFSTDGYTAPKAEFMISNPRNGGRFGFGQYMLDAMAVMGDTMYYSGYEDAIRTQGLWGYDGVNNFMIRSLYKDAMGYTLNVHGYGMRPYKGKLYFLSNVVAENITLLEYDPRNDSLRILIPHSDNIISAQSGIEILHDKIYFSTKDIQDFYGELYSYNLNTDVVQQVSNFATNNPDINNMTLMNNKLYFVASKTGFNKTYDYAWYECDGANAPKLLTNDINEIPVPNHRYKHCTIHNGELYFLQWNYKNMPLVDVITKYNPDSAKFFPVYDISDYSFKPQYFPPGYIDWFGHLNNHLFVSVNNNLYRPDGDTFRMINYDIPHYNVRNTKTLVFRDGIYISSDSGLFHYTDTTKHANIGYATVVTNTNIYPNPATGILYIDTDQPAYAIVYNISGQVMMTSNIDRNNNSINTSALPQGLYYLQLRNDGVQEMLKFIKQ